MLNNSLVRRELNLGTDDLPEGIDFISLPHLGTLVPAVVGLRTELVDRHNSMFAEFDQWRVLVSPADEQLLKRLLGREKGEVQEDVGGVRYNAVTALRVAHVQLSSLDPPLGTRLQICFAFLKDGRASVEWKATSIESEVRELERIVKMNEVIRAGNLFGYHKWWFIEIGKPEIPVPTVPQDEWFLTRRAEIAEVVSKYFIPVLQSLWRAEFAEGQPANQLVRSGYKIDKIGTTQLGSECLKELVESHKARLTSLTYLSHQE